MPAAAATLGPNSAIEAGVCMRTSVSMNPSNPHMPEKRLGATDNVFVLNSAIAVPSESTWRYITTGFDVIECVIFHFGPQRHGPRSDAHGCSSRYRRSG